MRSSHLLIVTLILLGAWNASGEPMKRTFSSDADMQGLEIKGEAAWDSAKDAETGGGSLRIAPGARVAWPLRASDGAGSVRFRVYDDGTKPADAKERRAGPRWGVVSANGRVLVAGAIYAPYLSGDATYAASACTPGAPGDSFFKSVQYLAVPRKTEWHEWTFDFDPAKGVRILHNGADVNAKRERFKWARTNVTGFAGIVFLGDEGKSDPQTIWVDDIEATLADGALAPPPTPSPASESATAKPDRLPAADPAPAGTVRLLETAQGRHPRLLFGESDIPALRKRAQGESRIFFADIEDYLKACKPGNDRSFQTNATNAQREGFWRLPTVALHYVLTGNADSLRRAEEYLRMFLATEHWETGAEQDFGMGAANIMTGVALAYDWLYPALAPALREQIARKLLLQARRMYHLGHLKLGGGTTYWQNDPQNNHRHHRNAGLALAVFAVAGDLPDTQWMLEQTAAELDFVHKWLPEDGSNHESPTYQVFGLPYLVLAAQAADRCLATQYMKHPCFRHVSLFQLHCYAPGSQALFAYGDSNEGAIGGYTSALFACTAAAGLADAQAGVMALRAARPKGFTFGWQGFLWFDPALAGGSIDKISPRALYPDMGIVLAREAWRPDAAAVMFKCGPYGGYTLNRYRNEGNGRYINVAHDDPDANTFLLFAHGAMVAKPDGYAKKKLTAAHNTILVNGKGQKGEGGQWTQPLKGEDMSALARIVAYREAAGAAVLAEGEAARMYSGLASYRRAVAWMPGAYMLVFDRIAAAPPGAEITWLVQSEEIDAPAGDGAFTLRADRAAVKMIFAANVAPRAELVESPAEKHIKTEPNNPREQRGKQSVSLGLRQLRLTAKTAEWFSAAVFDAWNRPGLAARVETSDDIVTVHVTGQGIDDTWRWRRAVDNKPIFDAYSRAGGPELVWSDSPANLP